MNASAARRPGFEESSAEDEFCWVIIGVLRCSLMFEGVVVEFIVDRESEYEGELWSRVVVETLLDSGRGLGQVGRTVSSSEKMERSSPFQRSPHSWEFYECKNSNVSGVDRLTDRAYIGP